MLNLKKMNLLFTFKVPVAVLVGMVLYIVLIFSQQLVLANVVAILAIIIGIFDMVKESMVSLTKKEFALDYIAILAIVVGLITQEYLVSLILAFMIATGSTLEEYGVSQAKKSLTGLIDRIPTNVTLWEKNYPGKKEKLSLIKVGMEIFIKRGEVIALDGILQSETGEADESSLTGEPYFVNKVKGDQIRSGTINIGQPIVIKVTKTEKDSTYKRIINMVKEAQNEKSPFVRLADRYSTYFTIITLIIGGFAFVSSNFDLTRVLSVLAVATPCPLIIATPIAFLGGINASAKRKIIIKKIAALELLSEVKTLVFDKTGTITLGTPTVTEIEIQDKNYSKPQVLEIAEAIERNSLHPLAKAVVTKAQENKIKPLPSTEIKEEIGVGISGVVKGQRYTLAKIKDSVGMSIALIQGKRQIAIFSFEDKIKQESIQTIGHLKDTGFLLYIFTGDKKEAAEKIAEQLGKNVIVRAELSPEDKQEGIKELKKEGKIVAMVGDGINDAPALALADVGIAFSNQEQTAASEAADIVFLGGNFSMVLECWNIAKRTMAIAKQSIFAGIGLSILAMVFASVGLISPIYGAALQEGIDVAVILNALRASQ